MNRMNKRGMTLTELIVSVALVSVIMVFMYQALSLVRKDKKKNELLTNNIVKISEIETIVENAMINSNITTIGSVSKGTYKYGYSFIGRGVKMCTIQFFNEDDEETNEKYVVVDACGKRYRLDGLKYNPDNVCYRYNITTDVHNFFLLFNFNLLDADTDKIVTTIQITHFTTDSWAPSSSLYSYFKQCVAP